MKFIFIIILLLSSAFAAESTLFDVLPGKLHKGGFLVAEPTKFEGEMVEVEMKYEIKKKGYVPVPEHFLKGTHQQKLPAIFMDERGYLELEKVKEMKMDDARIVYLGRIQYREYSDAHRVHIIPDNKKSEMFLTFHPSNMGLGWDQLKLILHTDLPILGDYVIEGKYKPHK